MISNRILVINDVDIINSKLTDALKSDGFQLLSIDNVSKGFELFRLWEPNLIIISLNSSKSYAFELINNIRIKSEIPIIVLSSNLDEEVSIISLQLGADDFLSKSINIEELKLRIRIILKHHEYYTHEKNKEQSIFEINYQNQTVVQNGKIINFNKKEFEIFYYLHEHKFRLIPHHELLKKFWNSYNSENTDILRTYIKRLRIKIEHNLKEPQFLITVPSIGYIFKPISITE